jgi:UDP-GlcNAc:undecaprenyl-phosphate GlcNAc-1-phosphate transferase
MALGIAAMSTPAVLHLSRWLRLLDAPDGVRKIHKDPIPRTGGIAIAAGFMAPLVGLLFFQNLFAEELKANIGRVVAFFGGALAILALGVVDDIRGCGAWSKLAVQTAVAVVLWQAGLRFESVSMFGTTYSLGIISLPVTILWVAGVVNALNLIDGLDGLAAGVGFFAAVSLFTNAWWDGNPILVLFACSIAGSLLGFLFYNFSPALIFMGDSGSMTIGYVFATAALWSAGKRSTVLALALPILALGLPLADTALAFFRRLRNGTSPFMSDRKHIHHRLIDAGMSHRKAVLVLYLVCSLLTGVVLMLRMWAL